MNTPPELLSAFLLWSGGIIGAISGIIGFSEKYIFAPRRKMRDAEFNDKIETIIKAIESANSKFDELEEKIGGVILSSKRNEYLIMITNHPEKVIEIEKIYDEYIQRGGNSYINDLHTIWREEFARHEIRNNIIRKDKQNGTN